jgi:hypothetical protein
MDTLKSLGIDFVHAEPCGTRREDADQMSDVGGDMINPKVDTHRSSSLQAA